MTQAREWAYEQFGRAELGHTRRTDRLLRIAWRAGERPAGRVSEVFDSAAERQAAYDFLEHDSVSAVAVSKALFESTARTCSDHARALVVIDGTSLSLRDYGRTKGFGRVGTCLANGTGLKVMNALALSEAGTPLGIAQQIWWSRIGDPRGRGYRSASDRESARWRECVDEISKRFATAAPDTVLHFVADREADAALLIEQLLDSGHEFTIRSNGVRKVFNRGRKHDMRAILGRKRALATKYVRLAATKTRAARDAQLELRAARIELVLRDRHTKKATTRSLTLVWARERGRVSGARLDWLLITNTDVKSAADVCAVVDRYTKRWRIEDFHKTWKSGVCRVEDTQLRSTGAVTKWATVLAAVATRVEQLRRLAREEPEVLASEALSEDEIEALILLKQKSAKRTERVTANGLTIAQAVRYIADLGGYVGANSSGKPGAITIGRGLQRVLIAAEVIRDLRRGGKLR